MSGCSYQRPSTPSNFIRFSCSVSFSSTLFILLYLSSFLPSGSHWHFTLEFFRSRSGSNLKKDSASPICLWERNVLAIFFIFSFAESFWLFSSACFNTSAVPDSSLVKYSVTYVITSKKSNTGCLSILPSQARIHSGSYELTYNSSMSLFRCIEYPVLCQLNAST